MSHPPPPRLATMLLAAVLSERDRDAVIGDLTEEYAAHAGRRTRQAACLWYWRQVVRSMPPLLRSSARRGRWVSTLGLASGLYILAGAFEFLAYAALLRLLAPDARMEHTLSLIVGLVSLAAGGSLANWMRPGTAKVLAVLVIAGVALLMATVPDSVPLWYQLAFLAGGPVVSLAGGSFIDRLRRAA